MKIYFITVRRSDWIKTHGIEAAAKEIDKNATVVIKKSLALLPRSLSKGDWIFVDKGLTVSQKNKNRFFITMKKREINALAFDPKKTAEEILTPIAKARSKK